MPSPHVNSLRPPRDILWVASNLDEAREHVNDLAGLKIGGLCVKKCIPHPSDVKNWHKFINFMELVTETTRGIAVLRQGIELRRYAREHVSQKAGKLVLFEHEKTDMHFDGYFIETKQPDGKITAARSYSTTDYEHYNGVGHHLTLRGSTRFAIERLGESEARHLRAKLPLSGPAMDAAWPLAPMSGEYVNLEAEDYLALHQYALSEGPFYLHGTSQSTPDRVSVCGNPQPYHFGNRPEHFMNEISYLQSAFTRTPDYNINYVDQSY